MFAMTSAPALGSAGGTTASVPSSACRRSCGSIAPEPAVAGCAGCCAVNGAVPPLVFDGGVAPGSGWVAADFEQLEQPAAASNMNIAIRDMAETIADPETYTSVCYARRRGETRSAARPLPPARPHRV